MSRDERIAALLARPGLQKIFAAFDGLEIRVVGGAVRDALLGEKVADIDLAIAAPPEATLARARAAGLKAVPTGFEHGTVTLVVDGAPFETTSLRADVETDGRRAKVRFGGTFAQDALRRDFTVNALSVDVSGRVHDYTDGLTDLEARKIRFIGDPRQRIAEDFLRILRFFRFSARYGGGAPDPAGFSACVALRDGLRGLSRERLGGELLKILGHPGSAPMVEIMSKAGLLEFLTVAPWPARLLTLAVRQVFRAAPDALLALAALGLHSLGDADRLAEALRLSRAQKNRLAAMAGVAAARHGASAPPPVAMLRRLLYDFGAQAAQDGLMLNWARVSDSDDQTHFSEALDFLRKAQRPRAPFAARDLLQRGMTPGAALGKSLKALEKAWIEAGFPEEPAAVEALLQAVVKPM